MKKLLIALLTVGLFFMSGISADARPESFCIKHPTHQSCQSTPTPRPTPTPSPTPTPTTGLGPKILFGLGSQAESAINSPLTQQSPIRILSSWHAKPQDNGWMTDNYHRGLYADFKARGFKLHLITWIDLPETNVNTPYGIACGREYPITPQWVTDMQAVATAMRPDYVTLMTEFQTYTCTDNSWSAGENEKYWQALIDNYERAVPIFRAVGSKVSIGWGGWQTATDRSLDSHFVNITRDFHSFQAMHGDSNVEASRAMTAFLGDYGPVMQAHHMPDGDTNSPEVRTATFMNDMRTLFGSDASVQNLINDGLFAWSIINDVGWDDDPNNFTTVKNIIIKYGK